MAKYVICAILIEDDTDTRTVLRNVAELDLTVVSIGDIDIAPKDLLRSVDAGNFVATRLDRIIANMS